MKLRTTTLLLASKSVSLRYLVLTQLLHLSPDHPEVIELKELKSTDPLVKNLIDTQNTDGSWDTIGFSNRDPYFNTIHALNRLSYLGYDSNYPFIQNAAEFLFNTQLDDGSWHLHRYRSTDFTDQNIEEIIVPLQTALPLASLVKCGYESDSRISKAFTWLDRYRLPDSSWPAKMTPDGEYPYQLVGYRKMPNSAFGCRTNTTQVLICYAFLISRKQKQHVHKTLDLLLSRETRDRKHLGLEISRTLGFEQPSGFFTYHGRFDLALILTLIWRLGAKIDDPRINDLVQYFQSIREVNGLWIYEPKPQASKWITFDILRSLSNISPEGTWETTQPRTRYQSYIRPPKRY